MHFPLFNTLRHTRLCLAALALGLGIHLPSQAQDGTLVAAGQITATTCKLFVGNSDGSSFSDAATLIYLGKSASSSGTAYQDIGTLNSIKTVLFFLGNPGETTPNLSNGCTSLGTGKWDISLQLKSSQIITRGDGVTLVKNAIAAPIGTDAAVGLYTASANDSTSATPSFTTKALFPSGGQGAPGQALVGDAGPTANLLAGGTGVTKTGKIWLTAGIYRSVMGTTTPTNGAYSASIPLLVNYK